MSELTFEQARELNAKRRSEAVSEVLAQFLTGADLATATAQVIAAYKRVEPVGPSECPHVDPEFGQCERDYGHDGDHWTTNYADPRRPDGTHPWDF